MEQISSSQECHRTILVFAQDIAPYDVFDDDSSNALVRQYLDSGGTVFWVGDIPFYYRSKPEEGHFVVETMAGRFSHLSILGVVPVFMHSACRFSITRKGRTCGLRSAWASLRPIVIPSQFQTDRTIIPTYPDYTTWWDKSVITEDAEWATSIWNGSSPLVICGQAYDPPESIYAPYFETNNNQSGSPIMPDNSTTWEYYDVAVAENARALVWWWYLDSYCSSLDNDEELKVYNVWAVHQEIWQKVKDGE